MYALLRKNRLLHLPLDITDRFISETSNSSFIFI